MTGFRIQTLTNSIQILFSILQGHHFDVKVLGCVANDVASDDFEIAVPETARRFYGLPACAPMHVYDSRNDEIDFLDDSGNILIKVPALLLQKQLGL